MDNIDDLVRETAPRRREPRVYHASKLWEFNVYGSIVAGLSGGTLLIVLALLVLRISEKSSLGLLFLLVAIVNLGVGLLILYTGNLIATFPHAVEVAPGTGLRLYAPWKRIYVPVHEIQDVKKSLLYQGYVIRLRRRRGLLRRIIIHWFFGREREALVRAIHETLEQAKGN